LDDDFIKNDASRTNLVGDSDGHVADQTRQNFGGMMRTTTTIRIATAGLITAALITASLAATTGVAAARTATTTTRNCDIAHDDAWPSWVQGTPHDIDPHTTSAIYMWHDTNGWNIRVTHHKTNLRTFSGELFTPGRFTDVRPVKLERDDQFQVSRDGHNITFLFNNYGGIDGLDFYTHCAPSITFAFQSDGRTTPPNNIDIGQHSSRPANDPFTISR
jgi:hypothetical protein